MHAPGRKEVTFVEREEVLVGGQVSCVLGKLGHLHLASAFTPPYMFHVCLEQQASQVR